MPQCKRAGVKRFNAPGIAGLQADYVERQLKTSIYRGYAYGDVGGHDATGGADVKVGQSTEMSPEMMKSVSEYIASMPTVAPKETLVNGDSDRRSSTQRFVSLAMALTPVAWQVSGQTYVTRVTVLADPARTSKRSELGET